MKRVLFDENVPRRLRRELPEYEISTVQEQGWAGVSNGELLRVAQETFAVIVTGDKRLRSQQNVSGFKIAVVVISLASVTPARVRSIVPRIKSAIEQAEPGSVVVVAAG